jgi:hypothetical protein
MHMYMSMYYQSEDPRAREGTMVRNNKQTTRPPEKGKKTAVNRPHPLPHQPTLGAKGLLCRQGMATQSAREEWSAKRRSAGMAEPLIGGAGSVQEQRSIDDFSPIRAAPAGQHMVRFSSAEEAKAAGLDATQMREAGFTAEQIQSAGFSDEQLQAAGFSEAELSEATAKQKKVGFLARSLQNYRPASLTNWYRAKLQSNMNAALKVFFVVPGGAVFAVAWLLSCIFVEMPVQLERATMAIRDFAVWIAGLPRRMIKCCGECCGRCCGWMKRYKKCMIVLSCLVMLGGGAFLTIWLLCRNTGLEECFAHHHHPPPPPGSGEDLLLS